VTGAASATSASTLLFPLDTLKKQLQVDGQHGRKQIYGGCRDACWKIFERGGLREFYRGLTMEVFKVAPGGAVLFVANDILLRGLRTATTRIG